VRLPAVSEATYRRFTGATLVAVGIIIVTGASVRLTGSGLGCTEWPTCTDGRLVSPLETHAMIEFGNRLVTGLIAVPVGLVFGGSFLRRPRRRDLTLWSAGLVAGVAVQAVIGGILVKVELAPAFTSIHFLSSMVLVWNAVVLHHRATTPDGAPAPVVARPVVNLGRVMTVLSVAVLATGAVVTGTGPHAGDEKAERYTFASITDVARVHSLVVWAFLAVTLLALWHLARSGAPPEVDRRGRTLVVAIVLQGALGYFQYAAGVPPYLVIVHVGGSVLIFVAALRFHLALFARPAEATAPATGTAPGLAPA
jgi:cytochrome c oxidase assembly protein subunit 15